LYKKYYIHELIKKINYVNLFRNLIFEELEQKIVFTQSY